MTYTPQKLLTVETFLAEYGNNPRYELADGELIDMEPTGNDVGDTAENFALTDQFGDTVHLQDFCGRPLLLELTAFT